MSPATTPTSPAAPSATRPAPRAASAQRAAQPSRLAQTAESVSSACGALSGAKCAQRTICGELSQPTSTVLGWAGVAGMERDDEKSNVCATPEPSRVSIYRGSPAMNEPTKTPKAERRSTAKQAKMSNGSSNGSQPLTLKHGAWATTVIVGLITISSTLVVPALMQRVDAHLEAELERHGARPHPGTVTREEMTRRFDTLATKESILTVGARLDGIDRRLQRIEDGR